MSNEAKPDQRDALKHPIQPMADDGKGVCRFKANAIVNALVEHGQKTGFGLHEIACTPFPREDREQLAQLTGYSHSGAFDLGYMSDEVLAAAEKMRADGKSEVEARNEVLRDLLTEVREGMREGVAALFGIHPDNLNRDEG